MRVKKIFSGCGLAAVAGVMWLVAACTPSGANSVPAQPIKAASTGITSSTAVNEPPTSSDAATVAPSTTTVPPVTNTPDPEGRTTPADIGSRGALIRVVESGGLFVEHARYYWLLSARAISFGASLKACRG